MPESYVDYGTDPFIAVNWEKVRYIRWLLDRYRHVVYADLDVGWLADPLWYLDAVAKFFPLAFQTEGLRRFPPVLCWGFLSALSSNTTLKLLDAMLAAYFPQSPGLIAMAKNVPRCFHRTRGQLVIYRGEGI